MREETNENEETERKEHKRENEESEERASEEENDVTNDVVSEEKGEVMMEIDEDELIVKKLKSRKHTLEEEEKKLREERIRLEMKYYNIQVELEELSFLL